MIFERDGLKVTFEPNNPVALVDIQGDGTVWEIPNATLQALAQFVLQNEGEHSDVTL